MNDHNAKIESDANNARCRCDFLQEALDLKARIKFICGGFFASFQLVFIVHYQWSMINRTVNAKCTYEITSSDRIFSFILCTVCLHCIHKQLRNGKKAKQNELSMQNELNES